MRSVDVVTDAGAGGGPGAGGGDGGTLVLLVRLSAAAHVNGAAAGQPVRPIDARPVARTDAAKRWFGLRLAATDAVGWSASGPTGTDGAPSVASGTGHRLTDRLASAAALVDDVVAVSSQERVGVLFAGSCWPCAARKLAAATAGGERASDQVYGRRERDCVGEVAPHGADTAHGGHILDRLSVVRRLELLR